LVELLLRQPSNNNLRLMAGAAGCVFYLTFARNSDRSEHAHALTSTPQFLFLSRRCRCRADQGRCYAVPMAHGCCSVSALGPSVPLDPADKQAHVKSNKGDDSSEGAGIKRDEAHQLHRLELLRA